MLLPVLLQLRPHDISIAKRQLVIMVSCLLLVSHLLLHTCDVVMSLLAYDSTPWAEVGTAKCSSLHGKQHPRVFAAAACCYFC
jgi:hypothetical protein